MSHKNMSADKRLYQLRKIAGSQIKLSRIRGTDNIVIRGGGKPLVKMITGNTGISAERVIRARRRLMRRKK